MGSFIFLYLVILIMLDGIWKSRYIILPTSQFNKIKESEGKSAVLTSAQQEWLTVQQLMATTRPEKRHPCPLAPIRRMAFRIVQSKGFDIFIIAVILLNIGTMFLTHQGQGKTWSKALTACNTFFTGLYVAEMVLKMMAIGIHSYFKVGCMAQYDEAGLGLSNLIRQFL